MTISPSDTRGAARGWPDRAFLFSHPAHLLALGLGVGLARRAPGTWGTLLAYPIYFPLASLAPQLYWPLILLGIVLGVWACERTGKALGVADHGSIVWDEIAAFLVVLPFAPPSPWGLALAFVLFRLFDIVKPFPIGWLDAHLRGGLGVMLDDLLAAAYSILCLWSIAQWT